LKNDTITYLTGSHYYHINTELSDKDYIQFVLPTDHDLFYGKFTSKSIKDVEDNDINIKDIRMLLKELKKGSLRMFEILYSKPIEQIDYTNVFNSLLKSLNQMRDDIFQEQKGELLKAIQGELTGRYKKFKAERSIKEYVHCSKLIWLFNGIYQGYNPFKLIEDLDYLATDYLDYLKQIRINCVSFKDLNNYQEKYLYLEKIYNQCKNTTIEVVTEKPKLKYLEELIKALVL
jgi:hypothetical protein